MKIGFVGLLRNKLEPHLKKETWDMYNVKYYLDVWHAKRDWCMPAKNKFNVDFLWDALRSATLDTLEDGLSIQNWMHSCSLATNQDLTTPVFVCILLRISSSLDPDKEWGQQRKRQKEKTCLPAGQTDSFPQKEKASKMVGGKRNQRW